MLTIPAGPLLHSLDLSTNPTIRQGLKRHLASKEMEESPSQSTESEQAAGEREAPRALPFGHQELEAQAVSTRREQLRQSTERQQRKFQANKSAQAGMK